MNTITKLRYMVCGGLLVAVGILVGVVCVSPLTAQNDKFGKITCTGLTVLGEDGSVAVKLDSYKHGGEVEVFGKASSDHGDKIIIPRAAVSLSATESGGDVMVTYTNLVPVGPGEDRMVLRSPALWLFTHDNGAIINVNEQTGNSAVRIGVGVYGRSGGLIDLYTEDEITAVSLGSVAGAGSMAVYNHAGAGVVQLLTDGVGGIVKVDDGHEKAGVLLSTAVGGVVDIDGDDGKSIIRLGASLDGGGAVELSKDGKLVKSIP